LLVIPFVPKLSAQYTLLPITFHVPGQELLGDVWFFSASHHTLTKVFFCCRTVKDVTEVVIAYLKVPSLTFAWADIEITEGSVTTSSFMLAFKFEAELLTTISWLLLW
jgi:hypothetical protein